MSEFRTEQDWLSAFAAQETVAGVESLLAKLARIRAKKGFVVEGTPALDGFRGAIAEMTGRGMTETEAVKVAVASLSDGLLFRVVDGQHR